MNKPRSRFAPSPTGFLHIGGARTALFAYLYAKHHGGEFILRIEDTDRERSTDAATQAIIDGMRWLGLTEDEGPFFQTERMDRYQEVLQQLLDEGKAYRCYCSKERLDQLRESQMAAKQKPRYDGHCRDRTDGDPSQPHVIRFKNPLDGAVTWRDQVAGEITVQNSELDDLIIARTDGSPTYNFTVVVDDSDMKITEVIRGSDHINNTPRQINIFLALGLEPPQYAHVPLILGEDGRKLSKRDGAANLLDYRDQGFLPEALLNYLVRLGWSHGDQEIFSMAEMIEFFDTDHINKAAAKLSQDKLLWMNQHYIKACNPDVLGCLLGEQLVAMGIDTSNGPALSEVALAQAERAKTLTDMAQLSRYFYAEVTEYDEKAAKKNFKGDALQVLQLALEQYSKLTDWKDEPIHKVILSIAESLDLKLGKVAQPLRVAVTGGSISPPLDVTLRLAGQGTTMQRLKNAIQFIQEKQEN